MFVMRKSFWSSKFGGKRLVPNRWTAISLKKKKISGKDFHEKRHFLLDSRSTVNRSGNVKHSLDRRNAVVVFLAIFSRKFPNQASFPIKIKLNKHFWIM